MVWDHNVKVWRSAEGHYALGDYWHPDGSRYAHCDDDLDIASEKVTEPTSLPSVNQHQP